jgi:hypothetical protein
MTINVNQIVEKMKEEKSQLRRASTLALVNAVKHLADAQTVRQAAIAYHTAEYGCKSVPADTMSYIDAALGLALVQSEVATPFNPNW